jgi:hypothetical protein
MHCAHAETVFSYFIEEMNAYACELAIFVAPTIGAASRRLARPQLNFFLKSVSKIGNPSGREIHQVNQNVVLRTF